VLADTGPLYAVVNPSDQYHARAIEELARLVEQRRTLVVIWPTVMETYSLILNRLGDRVAERWFRELIDRTPILRPEDADIADAATLLLRHSGQRLTLFDTVLGVMSRRLAVPVWTYDYHFDSIGSLR
jgi:predicted nucleic acid-binding protein